MTKGMGWAVWLPWGRSLRSRQRNGLAGLLREMKSAALHRGFVTVFDDEVE